MAPARGPCGGGAMPAGAAGRTFGGTSVCSPPRPSAAPGKRRGGGGAATPRGPLLLRVARAKPGRPGQDPQAAASGGGGAG